MNDRTQYEHHEARPRDGRRPEENGGTIWQTPREIALSALNAMGESTSDSHYTFNDDACVTFSETCSTCHQPVEWHDADTASALEEAYAGIEMLKQQIESMRIEHKKELRELDRDAREDVRDAYADGLWQGSDDRY